MENFLSWYLGPYQKITKGPFGIWTTVVAFAGLAIEHFLPDDSPSMYSQLSGLMSGKTDPNAMLSTLTKAAGVATPTGATASFDWSTLVDSSLTLLVLPLILMRLRDMGKTAPMLWVWVGVTYLGTLTDLLGLTGLDFGWFGTGAGVLTFVMWLWLSSAKTAQPPQPRHGAFVAAALADRAPAFDPRKPPPPDSSRQDF